MESRLALLPLVCRIFLQIVKVWHRQEKVWRDQRQLTKEKKLNLLRSSPRFAAADGIYRSLPGAWGGIGPKVWRPWSDYRWSGLSFAHQNAGKPVDKCVKSIFSPVGQQTLTDPLVQALLGILVGNCPCAAADNLRNLFGSNKITPAENQSLFVWYWPVPEYCRANDIVLG